jgi:hypothetical protein
MVRREIPDDDDEKWDYAKQNTHHNSQLCAREVIDKLTTPAEL